jgi:nitrogen fixation NifU-like protein
MINNEIIKLAANTKNVGLKNKYSHKVSLKNTICGDKITLEITVNDKRIISMNYETESCIYCEASASLLSQKIKNLRLKDLKSDFAKLKNLTNQKKFEIPKKYSEFKKLLNSDNFNRFNCIFLPFDAVIKALKL